MNENIFLHITPTIYNPYSDIEVFPVQLTIKDYGIDIYGDKMALSPNRQMPSKDFLVIHQKLPKNKYEFGLLFPIGKLISDVITVEIVWRIIVQNVCSIVSFQTINFNIIRSKNTPRNLLLSTGIGNSPVMLIKNEQMSNKNLDWVVKNYTFTRIDEFSKIGLLDEVFCNFNIYQEEKDDFYNDRYVKNLKLPTLFNQ